MKDFRWQDDINDWRETWRQLPMRKAFLSVCILILAATLLSGANRDNEAMYWQRYLIMLVALLVTGNLAIGPIQWLWRGALIIVGLGLSLEMLSASFS